MLIGTGRAVVDTRQNQTGRDTYTARFPLYPMFDKLDPKSQVKVMVVILATITYYVVLFVARGVVR